MENKKNTIIITGGGGVLGTAIAKGLAESAPTNIVLLGRTEAKLLAAQKTLRDLGLEVHYKQADVLNKAAIEKAFEEIFGQFHSIDVLINAAGGNVPGAVVMPEQHFYDMDIDDLDTVVRLNLQGTIIPSMIVSKIMIQQGFGNIINISSMAADRPMTRVVGYSAAKAGIDNFTKWLAVELCSKYGEKFRVNAIAPGFFVAEQNAKLLLNDDGTLTARGQKIIDNTPFKRFGKPEELYGTIKWLISKDSAFVTGIIIPIDGGFSAFSGV